MTATLRDGLKMLLERGLTQAEVLRVLHEAAAADITAHEFAIKQARIDYCDDECEIDDNPILSIAEDETGVWVSAWVWVPISAKADVDGRAYAKMSQTKAGDILIADGDFTCLEKGQRCEVKAKPDGTLYVDCSEDKDGHLLDGQADDGEHITGLYPAEPVKA